MSGLPLFTAAMNTPPEANVAYRRFFTARDTNAEDSHICLLRQMWGTSRRFFTACDTNAEDSHICLLRQMWGTSTGASRMARHRAPSLRVIEHLRQVLDAGSGAEVAYLRAA